MFAATRTTIQRQANTAARRFAGSHALPKQNIPEMYEYSFKKAFLKDPGTYPLIVVMCTATSIVLGMSANALYHYKDLRFSSQAKHSELQTWGADHYDSVTKLITASPFGFHRDALKNIRYEGLGVNHEEWKKEKAERDAAEKL
jgi:hypothetical protein